MKNINVVKNDAFDETTSPEIKSANPEQNHQQRRNFIKLAGGASLFCWSALPAFAVDSIAAQAKPSKKLVWVILRGALDSLHTVVPTFDAELKNLRPKLHQAYKSPLLPLAHGFALHPALTNLHAWYQTKEFTPIIAVGSGYGARSHFDGQDFLESGKPEIDHDSGWLARAIDIKQKKALAVAHSVPISLRSSQAVNTWYPSNLKESKEDIYAQLMKLYQNDDDFLMKLEEGLATKAMAGGDDNQKYKGKFKELATSCGRLLTDDNVDCAMLELGGWDTHNNQASRLDRKLAELDEGLLALKTSLGKQWDNTVVVVATEFGRTAKENGTGGTDHGTGSALFIAGGKINGGQILGKWPGLSAKQLFKGRDLQPTSNSFAWFSTILAKHWEFSEEELMQVFPNIKGYSDNLFV
ncbi:MAG: DUF1501 domain-containing protein [Thalassotalea sp.]